MTPEQAIAEMQARLLGNKSELLTEDQKIAVLFVLRQYRFMIKLECAEKECHS